jgi:RNA polymerase sigma-70 factor, ECF subfamily
LAINRFLADVERRAFRMAQLATGNVDDSLDLVQDAMLDFARRYAFKPEGEWPALFYRVLQSRITDWHRRATVRNRFRVWFRGRDDEDEGEDPFSRVADPSSPDPSRVLMNKASGEAITAALRTLSLRQQQAFLLRSWEGLGVAQTAFAMGCSEGSVKTHYSRAVHALQILLEEYRS